MAFSNLIVPRQRPDLSSVLAAIMRLQESKAEHARLAEDRALRLDVAKGEAESRQALRDENIRKLQADLRKTDLDTISSSVLGGKVSEDPSLMPFTRRTTGMYDLVRKGGEIEEPAPTTPEESTGEGGPLSSISKRPAGPKDISTAAQQDREDLIAHNEAAYRALGIDEIPDPYGRSENALVTSRSRELARLVPTSPGKLYEKAKEIMAIQNAKSELAKGSLYNAAALEDFGANRSLARTTAIKSAIEAEIADVTKYDKMLASQIGVEKAGHELHVAATTAKYIDRLKKLEVEAAVSNNAIKAGEASRQGLITEGMRIDNDNKQLNLQFLRKAAARDALQEAAASELVSETDPVKRNQLTRKLLAASGKYVDLANWDDKKAKDVADLTIQNMQVVKRLEEMQRLGINENNSAMASQMAEAANRLSLQTARMAGVPADNTVRYLAHGMNGSTWTSRIKEVPLRIAEGIETGRAEQIFSGQYIPKDMVPGSDGHIDAMAKMLHATVNTQHGYIDPKYTTEIDKVYDTYGQKYQVDPRVLNRAKQMQSESVKTSATLAGEQQTKAEEGRRHYADAFVDYLHKRGVKEPARMTPKQRDQYMNEFFEEIRKTYGER